MRRAIFFVLAVACTSVTHVVAQEQQRLNIQPAAPVVESRANDDAGRSLGQLTHEASHIASSDLTLASAGLGPAEVCKGSSDCNCTDCGAPRLGGYFDWLYLRPGNSDIVYAVEMTGPDPVNDSPTGPTGINQMGFSTGYRGGLLVALDECARVEAVYTRFDAEQGDAIQAAPTRVLSLQVGHPSVNTAGAGSAASSSDQELTMQLVDFQFKDEIASGCLGSLGYLIGARYAQLDQGFLAQQQIFAGAGLTSVATDVDFEGFGVRTGLDYQRLIHSRGLLLYAKGNASFIGGELKADFLQTNQFGGAAAIGNRLEDYRLVTILDAELGVGWQSQSGRLRLTAGYLFSGWLNALTNGAYIESVQTSVNNALAPGSYPESVEAVTFNGLTLGGQFTY